MEAAIKPKIHTYAGGLGILVGDKLRASEDMGLDVNVLTFAYPQGYVQHKIEEGQVTCETQDYSPSKHFKKAGEAEIRTKFGQVAYTLYRDGHAWLVDTELAPRLYVEACQEDRLKKEIVLGKVAASLFKDLEADILHVEESHGVFAALEVRKTPTGKQTPIIFTTHTPLLHGHERWEATQVEQYYGKIGYEGSINTSDVLRSLANKVNAVSRMHADNMRCMSQWELDYVTNGVRLSWMDESVKEVVESSVGDIHEESCRLAHAKAVTFPELRDAKTCCRTRLVDYVNKHGVISEDFSPDAFTIGAARRFSIYKRMDLLLKRMDRLESYAGKHPLQIVYSGLAHPHDTAGIQQIEKMLQQIGGTRKVKLAFLPGYDSEMGKLMVAGSDIWLDNPKEKDEACGTSWMKACINGTPMLGTYFGGVPEYLIDGQNAYMIGPGTDEEQSLWLAEKVKVAMNQFYEKSREFYDVARSALASSAGMTARRMMKEYFNRIYKF